MNNTFSTATFAKTWHCRAFGALLGLPIVAIGSDSPSLIARRYNAYMASTDLEDSSEQAASANLFRSGAGRLRSFATRVSFLKFSNSCRILRSTSSSSSDEASEPLTNSGTGAFGGIDNVFVLRRVAQIAGAARFCPPPASASGRSRDRSAPQTGGRRWSVGQIGLGKAVAAPRHDASSFRGSSARGERRASRASFGRQNRAIEILSLIRKSRSKPFLGGRSDGADRSSKKATECQLLFFWASVSTFENRLPSGPCQF